jgi:hypothetical protein
MNEADWNRCTDPHKFFEFLRAGGKLTHRKVRLFTVACCRGVWHLLTDERSRKALEVAEAHADGLVGSEELREAVLSADKASYRVDSVEKEAEAARRAARVARRSAERTAERGTTPAGQQDLGRARQVARRAAQRAEQLAARADSTRGEREAARAARLCLRAAEYSTRGEAGTDWTVEQAVEAAAVAGGFDQEPTFRCSLLRDLFGPLPFRPVAIPRPVKTWNGGTVQRLAEAAYTERQLPSGQLDPARLAVLADAVEEAGATDVELLGHLRSAGPHYRGCWAVDLLRGVAAKETRSPSR